MDCIVIESSIVKSNSINSTDKLVYGIIKALTNNLGYCYASNDYISKKINLSKRTVSKSISNLRKANYIRVETINYQRNIYLVNDV
ncbi:MAG TPA: helix-turn-helix domain-containing protein [Candidatus Faecimonas gallistercoris]|nr:helix-turn-helix domain-containing protein [Candidatus Faecimonas gallistercoris]